MWDISQLVVLVSCGGIYYAVLMQKRVPQYVNSVFLS